MLKVPLRGAALTLSLFVIAGCAGHTASATANGGIIPTLSRVAADSALTSAAVKVAGTYDGAVKVVERGRSRKGKVQFIIRERGKKISGSCDATFASGGIHFKLAGRIKSQSRTKARLAFTLTDPKGRKGYATATVTATQLVGKATAPPSGSNPEIKTTFKTKRK